MNNVPFINCFEVAPGREEVFMDLFKRVNAYMAAKPGYVAHRLHRSLAGDARFRFINYVEWESVEAWKAAHDEDFRAMVMRPEWAEFRSTPTLCEVVHSGSRAGGPSETDLSSG